MHLQHHVELCLYIACLYVWAMFDEWIVLEVEFTLTILLHLLRSINAFKVTFLLFPLTLDEVDFGSLPKEETRSIFIGLLESISPKELGTDT